MVVRTFKARSSRVLFKPKTRPPFYGDVILEYRPHHKHKLIVTVRRYLRRDSENHMSIVLNKAIKDENDVPAYFRKEVAKLVKEISDRRGGNMW